MLGTRREAGDSVKTVSQLLWLLTGRVANVSTVALRACGARVEGRERETREVLALS